MKTEDKDKGHLTALPDEALTAREVLELVRDCSSQEWQDGDGKRHAAIGNDGKRFWFITDDLMREVSAALATPVAPSVDAAWVEIAELPPLPKAFLVNMTADPDATPASFYDERDMHEYARAALRAHLSTALPAPSVPLVEKNPRVLNPMAEWPWKPSEEGSK